jgi:hypothetical protein
MADGPPIASSCVYRIPEGRVESFRDNGCDAIASILCGENSDCLICYQALSLSRASGNQRQHGSADWRRQGRPDLDDAG